MSRTPVESGVDLSVTKVNDSQLSFVAESSILDFAVVLDASLDINGVYMYFMVGRNRNLKEADVHRKKIYLDSPGY